MLRFTLTPDATFLAWRKDILLVAPLYSGVVQVFNTNNTISNSSTAVVLRVVGSGGKTAADKGTMTTFCRVSTSPLAPNRRG